MLVAMYVVAPTFIATPSILIATTTHASRPKMVLSNGVTIYGLLNSLDITKLAKVVNEFLKI
jgi:hypothetical protein